MEGPRLAGISIFWVGLSAVGDGLTTLVLPAQVDAAMGGPTRATALGVISLAGLLLAVLAQPVAGAMSDRLRPRWGRRGWIGLGVTAAVIALVGLALARSLIAIGLAYAAVLLAVSIAQAGQQGFIPDLVPTSRRGAAAGWKGLADVGGATLGFVAIGALLEGAGVPLTLVFLGGLLLLTYLLTLVLVREPRGGPVEPSQAIRTRAAFRVELPRDGAFVRLVASRFAFLLGIFGVGRYFLFFVEERLGMGAGEAGAILGVLALITFAASPGAGWLADRLGRLPVMRAGAALGAVGVAALVPARSTAHLLAAGGLMALGSAAFGAANWAATTDVLPPGEAARLMGLANVGTGGAAAAAGLFGPVIDAGNRLGGGAGYPALFLLAVASLGASALVSSGMGERGVGGIHLRRQATSSAA